jgi:hypothetical protein
MATYIKYIPDNSISIHLLESGSLDYIEADIFGPDTDGYAVTSDGYEPDDEDNIPAIDTKNSTTKWKLESADLIFRFSKSLYNGYGWNTTSEATFLAELKTFIDNNWPEGWGTDKLIIFNHFTFTDPIEGELDCYIHFIYQGNIGDEEL